MSDIDRQIKSIVKNAEALGVYLDRAITPNGILRKATKFVIVRLKAKAPVGETGNLERSIGYIRNSRYRSKVLIGPQYGKKGGNHANLIEFGFIHHSGKRVEGQPFVLETYEETKGQILSNLRDELKKEFNKAGKSIRGFEK